MREGQDSTKPIFGFDAFEIVNRFLEEESTAALPDDFGPYHFLGNEPLGVGALGDVWLADEKGAERRVAIKFLREVSEKDFAANEIKNQGRLEHRYIARLYSYGSLDDGTPWLAMEHVDGYPLDEYCRDRNCTIEERLRLFHEIAEAVQYAHTEKVDHGDLKPSNILVKENGEPKLLDFGFGRRIQHIDETLAMPVLGLTPAYAAPEQFRGESAGFRSDIYSLGVILYELLAEELPFDSSKLTYAEIKSLKATSQEPPPPSAIAKRKGGRRHDRRLSRDQWLDLDSLCLKAMDSDTARRYSSVESLIRDLDCYQRCQPLSARAPHSVRYRYGKFLKRNRAGILATTVVLTVIASIVTFFTARVMKERNKALAESARVQRIEQFMQDLFQGGAGEAGPSQDLRVVTILDRGIQDAQALVSNPKLQADFYDTLGIAYQSLGRLDRADSLLQSALSVRRAVFGSDHEETAESLLRLGTLRLVQDKLPEAEQTIREAIAIDERRLPSNDIAIIRAQIVLGQILEQEGAYDRAIRVLNPVVQSLSFKSEATKDLSDGITALANAHFYKGAYERAAALNREGLAIDRQLYGEHHPNLADDFINMGQVQIQQGRYADAETNFRQALQINQTWYGKSSPQAADAATYIAQSLQFQRRDAEAERLLEQALTALEQSYGKEHPRVAIALGVLGGVARDLRQWDKAKAYYRREAEIFRSAYGDTHPHTVIALSGVASTYLGRKQFVQAEQRFRDVIHRFLKTLPADSLNVGVARIKLGESLLGESRYRDAEMELLAGYQIVDKQSDPTAAVLKNARRDLATVYEALKEPQKASEFRATLAARK